MDSNSKLVGTGVISALFSLLCCATPLLAFVLGALGLAAYISKADYILIPVFLASAAMIAFAVVRRRRGREQNASQ